ncbi:MAG TPA: hypothetical protein VG496_07145 [Myxococcales bacterium]|nr:hypothetical protein [Myxococcales bacterium]
MAGRFTRFLRLERPHQPGEQHTPVAHPERFVPEEPRAPVSGLEVDEEPADEQPFRRCARCEMDNARFADWCVNCGAPLHTPEQELYNRQLWQKRRKEAQAEEEALQRMHAPPPPPADPEVARQRLRQTDARYALGETLAQEVMQREQDKLFWMTGMTSYSYGFVPLGVRVFMAMSPAWRWRVGIAILLWLAGTGTVALRTHNQTAMWLFFGSLILLLILFTPSRPRRRFWWSSGDWW